MKRIAEWFAAVGAAAGRKGKRLVAIVAAVAMLGGVAGVQLQPSSIGLVSNSYLALNRFIFP